MNKITIWFGKGVGIVKSQDEQYYDGELSVTIVKELTAYTL